MRTNEAEIAKKRAPQLGVQQYRHKTRYKLISICHISLWH